MVLKNKVRLIFLLLLFSSRAYPDLADEVRRGITVAKGICGQWLYRAHTTAHWPALLWKISQNKYKRLGEVNDLGLRVLEIDTKRLAYGSRFSWLYTPSGLRVGDELVAIDGALYRFRKSGLKFRLLPKEIEKYVLRAFELSASELRRTWIDANFAPTHPEFKSIFPLLSHFDGSWTTEGGIFYYDRRIRLRVSSGSQLAERHYDFLIDFGDSQVAVTIQSHHQLRIPNATEDCILPAWIEKASKTERLSPATLAFLNSSSTEPKFVVNPAAAPQLIKELHEVLELSDKPNWRPLPNPF